MHLILLMYAVLQIQVQDDNQHMIEYDPYVDM